MVNFDYKVKKVTLANGEAVENIINVWMIGRNDSFIGIQTETEKYAVPLASVAKMEIE